MLSLFFGVPGCGKSTLIVKMILDFQRNHTYKHIYVCNLHVNIPGVIEVSNSDIGRYDIRDGVLFIDEASIFADNRASREFDKGKLEYFVKHRHKSIDVYCFSQYYNGVDKKLRNLTTNLYFMYRPVLTGRWVTKYYRIGYGIIIPDAKSQSQKLGEIVEGYSKPSLLVRLFAHRMWRPKYYKYFDSLEDFYLPPLPQGYAGNPAIPVLTKKKKKKDKSCEAAELRQGDTDDIFQALDGYVINS